MGEWLGDFEQWLRQYDIETDLTTVWVLCIGFQIYAFVKFYSWWQIARQDDHSDVGRSLKWQKMAEGVMGECMSILYGLTLFAYYAEHQFGVLERLLVRALVVVGIIGAVLWGLRLVGALRRENRLGDNR